MSEQEFVDALAGMSDKEAKEHFEAMMCLALAIEEGFEGMSREELDARLREKGD